MYLPPVTYTARLDKESLVLHGLSFARLMRSEWAWEFVLYRFQPRLSSRSASLIPVFIPVLSLRQTMAAPPASSGLFSNVLNYVTREIECFVATATGGNPPPPSQVSLS